VPLGVVQKGRCRSMSPVACDAHPGGFAVVLGPCGATRAGDDPLAPYMACSRQIRNALNATATAQCPNTRGATAAVGSARRHSLSGRKHRNSSECANHCARHTAEKFAGALQAQCAAPRIPLSLWRRPLSPVVNRDTKASRLELTARSPGGTTVAEGAQSRES
jgi:hypothetical protein